MPVRAARTGVARAPLATALAAAVLAVGAVARGEDYGAEPAPSIGS